MISLARNTFKKLYLQTPFIEPSLDKIVAHAREKVPYYRKFENLSFEEFPFLTKDIIRKEFENLKSDEIHSRKHFIKTSGGSTGEPVKLIQDIDYKKHQRVVAYQQKERCGYHFGEPMIHLWGSEKDILAGGTGKVAKTVNYLKNLQILNAFRMGESQMRNYLKTINLVNPKLIVAYVQPMFELAQFAERNNIKINPPGAIMTSAGTLHPFMKQEIEQVFKCPVYNRYGSREVGAIAASEKGMDELRISKNNVFIEVVDENGFPCPDDVEGEIVVSSLVNYSMPLLRYKIGDRGSINRSKYEFPVLANVAGRVTEVLKNSIGELIPAEYFIHIVGVVYHGSTSWIKRFRIVQKNINEIEIRIVRNNVPVDENQKQKITAGIKKVMGNDCKVDYNYVDEIPLLSSGKYAYVISEIR